MKNESEDALTELTKQAQYLNLGYSDVNQIYTKEFKEKWFGTGEWVNEPDVVKFEYKGYKCMVYRVVKEEPYSKEEHWFGGHLCGYVVLLKGHKFYGKSYDDIDIDCHGGLTFSEVPEGKGHLIGFDCAHSGDFCPSIEKMMKEYRNREEISSIPKEFEKYSIFNPIYRNVEYCVEQCKNMVDQLMHMTEIGESK